MVGFPLLLIPLAIYNIIVFLMPGVSFADPLVKLTLMSGAEWPLTLSDILLALGILLLLLEIIKGARPGSKYLTDHLLSLIIFGGAAAARREVSPPAVAARQPPQFDPAPAPSAPAAASVAESVLLDHPEPTLAHPEAASHAPSPEVPSPGLQPGEGSPPPRDATPH